jgi:hypothetical protein
MPSSAGRLRARDVISHGGRRFAVIARVGNHADYSVRIRAEDRQPFQWHGQSVTEAVLTEAGWKISHTELTGWRLEPTLPDRRLAVLLARLDALAGAIRARDWGETECQYDRVLSQATKLAGTRSRHYDRGA